MSAERGFAPFVVTIGETMVALVAEDAGPLRYASRFQRRAAGAESNVAIGLARLGVSAGWVSRVGDDEFGSYVCAAVRGEDVDVSHVELDPDRPTGIMIKELRPVGKSRVLYYRSGSAASALSPQTLPTTYLQQAQHLHLTGITPALSPSCADAALTAARTVVEAGGTVSFGVNLRSQLGVNDPLAMFGPFIDLARILFLGIDEAEQLFRTHDTQDIERELTSLGVPTIILKLGANGARACTAAEDRWIDAPGYKVPVVDEVGAGDAFAAAYLASTFRGIPVGDALRIANAAGALAIPGVLTASEVTSALALGARLMKLFPAEPLGPAYLNQMLGPFPDLRLVPTGGVGTANAAWAREGRYELFEQAAADFLRSLGDAKGAK